MSRRMIKMKYSGATAKIFGSFDSNADMIEKHFSVTLRNRESEAGDSIILEGEDEAAVDAAARCISYLHELSANTDILTEQSVTRASLPPSR